MKANQSKEDYLETIYLLSNSGEYVHQIDVARKLSVSQPAVKKAILILQAEGYIKFDGLHIYLTSSGEEYAKKIFYRHVTLKNFLIKIGVSEDVAEEDACKMEHILSSETFSKMENFLK